MQDLKRLSIDRVPASTTPRCGGVVWGLGVVVLLLIAYLSWERVERGRSLPPEVEVARVQRVGGVQAQAGVAANGYVVARTRAALSTDVPGRLVEIPVREGDRVRRGDLMARLDTRLLEAELAEAKAHARREEAGRELTAIELRRACELRAAGGDRLISEIDVEAARARHAQSEAGLLAALAAVERVEVLIANSSVRAPFDGVVVEKSAEVGEIVSTASAGTNARGAVVTLIDPESLEIQVELVQTSLPVAREGTPVLVFLDAFPEDAYAGRVRQVWPTANRQKASVELRIELLDRDERFLLDLGVRVVFQESDALAPQPARVWIPSAALRGGSESCVFLYEDGIVARRAVVTAGVDAQGRWEVEQGLEGNELVVLSPPASLRDGDRVRRKEN